MTKKENLNLNLFLQQPRVKQLLRDGWVPYRVKQLILRSDVPIEAKEALIANPYQDTLIDDFCFRRFR